MASAPEITGPFAVLGTSTRSTPVGGTAKLQLVGINQSRCRVAAPFPGIARGTSELRREEGHTQSATETGNSVFQNGCRLQGSDVCSRETLRLLGNHHICCVEIIRDITHRPWTARWRFRHSPVAPTATFVRSAKTLPRLPDNRRLRNCGFLPGRHRLAIPAHEGAIVMRKGA